MFITVDNYSANAFFKLWNSQADMTKDVFESYRSDKTDFKIKVRNRFLCNLLLE